MTQMRPYTDEEYQYVKSAIGDTLNIPTPKPKFNIQGTTTGRTQIKNPNASNEPQPNQLNAIYKLLKSKGLLTFKLIQIHDSIQIVCDRSEEDALLRLLPEVQQIMSYPKYAKITLMEMP